MIYKEVCKDQKTLLDKCEANNKLFSDYGFECIGHIPELFEGKEFEQYERTWLFLRETKDGGIDYGELFLAYDPLVGYYGVFESPLLMGYILNRYNNEF